MKTNRMTNCMKKEYFKPSIKLGFIGTDCLLAGSTSVGISEDPATGPALGKESHFSNNEENFPSSVWED